MAIGRDTAGVGERADLARRPVGRERPLANGMPVRESELRERRHRHQRAARMPTRSVSENADEAGGSGDLPLQCVQHSRPPFGKLVRRHSGAWITVLGERSSAQPATRPARQRVDNDC